MQWIAIHSGKGLIRVSTTILKGFNQDFTFVPSCLYSWIQLLSLVSATGNDMPESSHVYANLCL